MRRLRILLADDHKMFAQGLRSLFQNEYELLASVENGQALVDAASILNPDIIIVDISMPVMNGFDAVRQLKKDGSSAKIIFLTMHADEGLVEEALRCGASGYVLKQSVGEELMSAITQVSEGKIYLPQFMDKKLDQSSDRSTSHSLNLTPRQREVLRLIAQGRTMKEIAAQLGISTRTAESHKYEMMEGLGINTSAELVQYAMKLGLIST
ncbi:MAG TPA: response regulator transcription factor [Pyrinomonadaceae bacterium]|nr:response regulator transcription factor [Pyrinomonadaceae bacterium]